MRKRKMFGLSYSTQYVYCISLVSFCSTLIPLSDRFGDSTQPGDSLWKHWSSSETFGGRRWLWISKRICSFTDSVFQSVFPKLVKSPFEVATECGNQEILTLLHAWKSKVISAMLRRLLNHGYFFTWRTEILIFMSQLWTATARLLTDC